MRTDTIKHFFGCTLTARAKHIVWVCIFMWAGIMPLSAQVYSTAKGGRYDASYSTEYSTTQHSSYSVQDAQVGYNSYQSTVYQPFASSPSMVSGRRNTGSAPSTGGDDPTNPNLPNDNDPGDGELPEGWLDPEHPSDPGHQSPDSPVGEAWVMLLFAAAAALAVYIRQRKAVLRG